MQDAELLRSYLKDGSEEAFAELVGRYAGLVYATASRQLGDASLAEEVSQTVFCVLARKAGSLSGKPTLAGWLYRATWFAAAKASRAERRRRRLEQEASQMNVDDPAVEGTWAHLSPMLDLALNQLGEKDRLAVLLRFFQRKPMREIGQTLGVSEEAAKMRVGRAVEHLRQFFARRGVACSAAALAAVLTEKAGAATPPSVISKILASSMSRAAAPAVSVWSISHLLMLMAKINTKTLVASSLGALLVLTLGLHVLIVNSSGERRNGGKVSGQRAEAAKPNPPGNLLSPGASPSSLRRGNAASPLSAARLAELTARLRTVLHTRGTSRHPVRNEEIALAVWQLMGNPQAAFAVLKEAAQDSELFVQQGAIYGMGKLGKSVPEAVPYLWDVLHAPPPEGTAANRPEHYSPRFDAFMSLRAIGLEPQDIPTLAELLPTELVKRTLMAGWVPAAISGLIEQNPQSVAPYIRALEGLLDSSDADVRLFAALALARHEGADNPQVFQEIQALYRRPDDKISKYYKMLALDNLQALGAMAKPFVPALKDFAQSADEVGIREMALGALGSIDPGLRSTMPEVDQALRAAEDAKAWADKWMSGAYSLGDLQAALKDPAQALTAAVQLGDMGAAAESTVPDMIKALWGKDQETRGKILEAIQKIDPQVTISRVDAHAIGTGLIYARSALRDAPPTVENRLLGSYLTSSCSDTWFTREELADFVNRLAAQRPDISEAFVKGVLSEAPGLKDLLQPANTK